MKKIVGLLLFISTLPCYGQVGINTLAPDSSAALEVRSPQGTNKGFLTPRFTDTEIQSISNPADGLLIYNTDRKVFQYFEGALQKWLLLTPSKAEVGSGPLYPGNVNIGDNISNVGINTPSPGSKLEVTGNVKVNGITTTDSLKVGIFPINSLVPQGAIIMWSGSGIPTGWALCDGSNGTPDLRERFIVGAGGDNTTVPGTNGYAMDDTGGENTHVLTTGEMPSHNHGLTMDSHTHDHAVNPLQLNNNPLYYLPASPTSGSLEVGLGTTDSTTSTGTISNTGGSTAHENRPPYYALAFIIKL